MLQRNDDLRDERYAYTFSKLYKSVGANGVEGLCAVTNGGKTNKAGRIEYTGALPHVNPLLCCLGARGMLLLERHQVMNEAAPDFLEPKSFFTRPTIRAATKHDEPQSYPQSYKNVRATHKAAGVMVTKVTHQGRGEGQRALQDGEISLDHIRQMAHCFSVQKR